MATTSIWPINGSISHVLTYVGNPDKTTLTQFSEKDLQALKDVMDYAVQPSKTEQQRFVSGINCLPEIARQQMIISKKRFDKVDGRTAYHAYQSFKPGEITPQTAHEIGMLFAQQLWGDRFQVVVATHIDKAHVHNHFVINSVSFLDGKKFHSDCKSYFGQMRVLSDQLCESHGLSTLPTQSDDHRSAMTHKEWQEQQEGRQTWRGLIRQDVDEVLAHSSTWSQFTAGLKEKGYEVKVNVKHVAVRPPGKERFIRLRSLGDDYAEDALKERILKFNSREHNAEIEIDESIENNNPRTVDIPNRPPIQLKQQTFNTVSRRYSIRKQTCAIRKRKGPVPLYIRYMYQMGALRPRSSQPRRAHFLLREDIRHLDRIIDGFKLLRGNNLNSFADLQDYKWLVKDRILHLLAERKNIHLQKSKAQNQESIVVLADQASLITQQLKQARKELRLCDDIQTRSLEMTEKLKHIQTEEHVKKQKDKEVPNHDQRR
jgi:hypothetical protein